MDRIALTIGAHCMVHRIPGENQYLLAAKHACDKGSGPLPQKKRGPTSKQISYASVISPLSVIQPITLAAASTKAPAAAAAYLPGVVAVPAINRAVAARLKRDGSLLPASGTSDRRALWLGPAKSSSAGLFILFCLTACLATLGNGITTLCEKRLVFG